MHVCEGGRKRKTKSIIVSEGRERRKRVCTSVCRDGMQELKEKRRKRVTDACDEGKKQKKKSNI